MRKIAINNNNNKTIEKINFEVYNLRHTDSFLSNLVLRAAVPLEHITYTHMHTQTDKQTSMFIISYMFIISTCFKA